MSRFFLKHKKNQYSNKAYLKIFKDKRDYFSLERNIFTMTKKN